MSLTAPKRQKYGSRRCTEHQPAHASLKECRRAGELRLLERAGQIRNLREQVAFELAPAVVIDGRKKPALRYVADWTYEERHELAPGEELRGTDCRIQENGRLTAKVWRKVTEDCKGMQTPAFRLKRHLMAAKGLEVRLT